MAIDLLQEHLLTFTLEGVSFPALDTSLSAGHDAARHKAYRQRGEDVEDTGPKAKTFRVKVPLYASVRWPVRRLFPDVYRELVPVLEQGGDVQLIHPTRGLVTVHVDDWTETFEGRTKDGLTLEIVFGEQRGEAQRLRDFAPVRRPEVEATAAAVAAEEAAAELGLLARLEGFADDVADVMDELAAADTALTQAVATADALIARCESIEEDPAFAASQAFPLRSAVGATRAAVAIRRAERAGDAPRTFRVPSAMSVTELAAHPSVYGDASRAADLLEVNAFADPSEIPAGTSVLVPA